MNRAARIMTAAHGGQVLLSQAVVELVREYLPSDVKLNDLGSVRLRHSANPERVYQLVHPRLRQDFPALRSLEATPNNLPQQLTSFIGREHELSEAGRLLAGARLLTIVGPGGIGKTRLSLQVAADVLDNYLDGVWFVELASIVDPTLVPKAVAQVLGLPEDGSKPIAQSVCAHLASRQLLLVLDNCEHLVDACARLAAAVLRAAQKIRILATSREALNVAGEQTYTLPSLTLPNSESGAEVTARSEAVQLFVAAAPAPAKPTADPSTDAMMAAEKSIGEAWRTHDARKIQDLTAKDIAFVNIFGTYFANKVATIEDRTSATCEVKSFTLTDGVGTSVSPTVGILTLKGSVDGARGGQDISGQEIYGTSVYVKGWRRLEVGVRLQFALVISTALIGSVKGPDNAAVLT